MPSASRTRISYSFFFSLPLCFWTDEDAATVTDLLPLNSWTSIDSPFSQFDAFSQLFQDVRLPLINCQDHFREGGGDSPAVYGYIYPVVYPLPVKRKIDLVIAENCLFYRASKNKALDYSVGVLNDRSVHQWVMLLPYPEKRKSWLHQ